MVFATGMMEVGVAQGLKLHITGDLFSWIIIYKPVCVCLNTDYNSRAKTTRGTNNKDRENLL